MAQFNSIETGKYNTVVERVTGTVNLGSQLNLHRIAQKWYNVEYENGKAVVQLRNPEVTAHISSEGEMLCYATSEEEVRTGVRQVARKLQKEGFDVRLGRMHVDIHARCTMPFRIRLGGFALCHPNTKYEPELCESVEYRIPDLNARLSIHSTGHIEITAPTRANVDQAAEHIYSRVRLFRIPQE